MNNICRICLKVSDNLFNLFEDNILPQKIKDISCVEISIDDNLPSSICDLCTRNIHLLYDFRQILIRSNMILTEKRIRPFDNCESDVKLGETLEEEFGQTTFEEGSTSSEQLSLEQIDELDKPYVINAIQKANERKLNGESIPKTALESKKPPKNSICSICGVTVRSFNFSKHLLIHNGKPVNCRECGKTCKNTESLRGHMFMHKGIILECKICNKVYKHRGAFSAHRKRHALGDVKTVPCNLCGKLFYDKQVLQKHIRSHTGERPYPCKYCNKGFSSIHARNTHIRRHTNERPYACQFCSFAFPQKVSLKTHMKSKHPNEVDALQTL